MGECLPSSDRRSRPGVGRRPTAKIEYFASWDAPIIPEKCASDGYSNGCVVLVQVLLMMTVYSAGSVGTASRAAGGAAGGAGFDPLPHPAASTAAAAVATRARMSHSGRRKCC